MQATETPIKKIYVITSSWPTSTGETFIEDELTELIRNLGESNILVIPLRKRAALDLKKDFPWKELSFIGKPLFDLEILVASLKFSLLSPGKFFFLLGLLVRESRNAIIFLKNLAVFPKAIWISKSVINQASKVHLHGYWATTPATVAWLIHRILDVDFSFTVHRSDLYQNNLGKIKSREAKFIRHISQKGKKDWRKLGNTGNSVVLHLGTRMPKELKKLSYEYEKPTLHVPARLIRVKGHRILIEAIALLTFEQRPEVFLYGDGPCRRELEAKVVFEGVEEHFKFFGQVNRNFIFEIYGKSRFPIVVLPSLELPRNQHEGIPFALIEAMSMSIPVISTNSGSIPELLQDFQEFLVAPGNVSELRSAIHRLTNNLDLYTELSIKSKMVIDKNFNASITASKFQGLCK